MSSWSHATLRQTEPFVWLTHIIDPFVPAASIGLLGAAIAAVFGWRPGPVGRTIVALCIAVLIATIAGGCLFGTVGLVLAAPLLSAAVRISADLRAAEGEVGAAGAG